MASCACTTAPKHAVKTRDEVLGIVAHDLRNPVNAIVLFVRMLHRHHVDPGALVRRGRKFAGARRGSLTSGRWTFARGYASLVAGGVNGSGAMAEMWMDGREASLTVGAGGPSAVTYAFRVDDDDTRWNVAEMRVEEALNEPYEAVVVLAFHDENATPTDLLGKDGELVIARPPLERLVRGVIRRVELVDNNDRDGQEVVARLYVVPAVWALGLGRDTRIFQEMTVPQILEQVLSAALAPYGREIRMATSGRTYPEREYCLQYQESNLAFVSRLMEEEGITYYFDHTSGAGREVLVLTDHTKGFERGPTLDGRPVPIATMYGVITEREPVLHFEPAASVVETKITINDFDWTQDSPVILGDRGEPADRRRDRERYEHDRALSIARYAEGPRRYQQEDSAAQLGVRRELQERDSQIARGRGRVSGFAPGRLFDLASGTRPALDGEYLLTRVVHYTERPAGDDAPEEVRRDPYHNRFECIPASVPYRPSRTTPKPRIHGMQSAVVVGPAGEEVHTDAYGRIKVQFKWDRLGAHDEHSSCWVRVVQAWAGRGWGAFVLPRIGMEVIVSFLDGDPDRPIVTGCVYNGQNPPPYPLPEDKTKSTFKTNSSLGGGGFNEMRYEDRKGSEEIFVHAQKDYNEVVLHDHTTRVHHDQKNQVDVDQTELIGRHQRMTVGVNRVHSVGVDEVITVGVDQRAFVGNDQDETVGANHSRKVGGKQTVMIGESRDHVVGTEDSLRVGTDRKVEVGGKSTHRAVREVEVFSGERILLCAGASTILIKK
jgi:type VI secretion system secreted protein VgrG